MREQRGVWTALSTVNREAQVSYQGEEDAFHLKDICASLLLSPPLKTPPFLHHTLFFISPSL